MESPRWLYLLLLTLPCGAARKGAATTHDKAIYGDDNRREPYELPNGHCLQERAQAVAVIMPAAQLLGYGRSFVQVKSPTLGSKLALCQDVAYREQPAPGYCTGFLVADDILATAGHCIKSALDCSRIALVFDFALTGPGDSPRYLRKESVFGCSALISRQVDSASGIDFAFLRLDRPARNRTPFDLSQPAEPVPGARITMLGHPSGIPLKITTHGRVRDDSHPNYMRVALDSFSGNSGSPVLEKASGQLVGMLVRGESSYRRRSGERCYEPTLCEPNGCRGEDILRTSVLATEMPRSPDPLQSPLRAE